jgi:hypothetical protein
LLNFILLGQGGGKGVFIFLAHDSWKLWVLFRQKKKKTK